MKFPGIAFVFAGAALALPVTVMAQHRPSQSDPVDFCRTAGNVDEPGLQAGGPHAGSWVRSRLGLRREQGAMVAWRCMNGHVLACVDGGGSAHCAKGSANRAVTAAMRRHCSLNPDQALPVAVTGTETIFAWTCAGRTPRIERQWAWLDRRGFIATDWRILTPRRG